METVNTEKKRISIIIPVRFRPDLTEVCIDSILKYTKDFELILVQEGEDKQIRDLLISYSFKPHEGKYDILQNKIPRGYAGALNAGLAIATGDYYCFMNNDTVATPLWMDEMLKAFEDPEVGLVAPTFWGMGNRQSVDWNDGKQFDKVIDPFDLCGVCYLISKECMLKVGLWDESFGHGGEDFDMNIRIQNANYKMIIARKSFIYHYGGASTRELFGSPEKARKNMEEKLAMLEQKHKIDIKSKFNLK